MDWKSIATIAIGLASAILVLMIGIVVHATMGSMDSINAIERRIVLIEHRIDILESRVSRYGTRPQGPQ